MEGYNNSYQNSSSARETEFQRLAQNIGTNIQKIQQNGDINILCSLTITHTLILLLSHLLFLYFDVLLLLYLVASMQRMITQIGTPQDNNQLQQQL